MDFSGDFLVEWADKLDKSDEFIEQMEQYLSKLKERDLPVIFSPLHMSRLMGMSDSDLTTLLNNREKKYSQFRIKKKKQGEYRYISAPIGELYIVQQWIKVNILDKLHFGDHLTSYQKGKSILDNARRHVGQEMVIKFDLENFFESITQDKVYGIFKLIGYNTAVAIELARACCQIIPQRIGKPYNGDYACLPQGAPTSPTLSNLSAIMLDFRLLKYAASRNLQYSRYADDITFSGKVINKPKQSTISNIVTSEGFGLNIKKTKYLPSSTSQVVTGLNVNNKVSIPKSKRRTINTHIYNCLKFGPFANIKKFRLNYREWLLGNIVYIQMVHPFEGRKMREKFDRISWL